MRALMINSTRCAPRPGQVPARSAFASTCLDHEIHMQTPRHNSTTKPDCNESYPVSLVNSESTRIHNSTTTCGLQTCEPQFQPSSVHNRHRESPFTGTGNPPNPAKSDPEPLLGTLHKTPPLDTPPKPVKQYSKIAHPKTPKKRSTSDWVTPRLQQLRTPPF